MPITSVDAYRGIPNNCIIMIKASDDSLVCISERSTGKIIQRNYAYFGEWESNCGGDNAEINIKICYLSLPKTGGVCIANDLFQGCIITLDIPTNHRDCKMLFKIIVDYNMTNRTLEKEYSFYNYFPFSHEFCNVVDEIEKPYNTHHVSVNDDGAKYLFIHDTRFIMLDGLSDKVSIYYSSIVNDRGIWYDFIFYSDDMRYDGRMEHEFFGIGEIFILNECFASHEKFVKCPIPELDRDIIDHKIAHHELFVENNGLVDSIEYKITSNHNKSFEFFAGTGTFNSSDGMKYSFSFYAEGILFKFRVGGT